MYQRLSKVIVGMVVAGVLATGASAALDVPAPQAAQPAAKQKAVKDQGEYDIITAAQKETDPQKKLDILKQWEQKYPDSDFKDDRTLAQLQAYSQIASLAKATTPEGMDAAVKAANTLLENLDKFFASKPGNVSDADWAKARSTTELSAHTVLGYVAMQQKNDAVAEAEYKKVLMGAPDSAQISYWLGSVIARQRRIPEALYHFARAVSVTGPLALDATTKASAERYLDKQYNGYHGSDEGLADLKALAVKSPMPPEGWTLKSIEDIEKEKAGSDADFEARHPDVALWRKIRAALKADDGDKYFTQIKGAGIPPEGQAGFKMFKAKVVSQPNPKELIVNVDSSSGDATLKFETALKTVDPSTAIEFKGVVDAYVKDPYMLTLLITEKTDISGLPPGTMGAEKKATPRKAVTKKK